MAKAKSNDDSNVVELRKNGPAEDAIIALNIGKYRRELDEFSSASGRLRNTAKHVEGKGVNLKAAKRAISIQKSGRIDEVLSELTALFQYLKILGHPLTKAQLDLFAVEAPRTPALDKAKEHGRYVGIMGLGQDQNPYSIDSEQGQAWMKAWHQGGEERGLILALEPEGELISGDDDDGGQVFDGEEPNETEEDDFDRADPSRTAAE